MRICLLIGSSSAMEAALRTLDSLGLADRAPSYPDQPSGGERQRIAIARAVVGDQQLLLADAPGNGGIPARRAVFRWGRRLFRREWRRHARHDDLAAQIAAALIETLVARIKITEPDRIEPVFRIPNPAHPNQDSRPRPPDARNSQARDAVRAMTNSVGRTHHDANHDLAVAGDLLPVRLRGSGAKKRF